MNNLCLIQLCLKHYNIVLLQGARICSETNLHCFGFSVLLILPLCGFLRIVRSSRSWEVFVHRGGGEDADVTRTQSLSVGR